MFSRNKRKQTTPPIKAPVRPMPKEPVLSSAVGRDAERKPVDNGARAETVSNPTTTRKPGVGQVGVETRLDGATTLESSQGATAVASAVIPASVLSADLHIVGNVETSGALTVHGQITGDVTANELVLGADSTVDGTIRAQRLDISGVVNGTIFANDVQLTHMARVNGDVNHCALAIETGAELNGAVRRSDEPVGPRVDSIARAVDTGPAEAVTDKSQAESAIELPIEASLDSEALRLENTGEAEPMITPKPDSESLDINAVDQQKAGEADRLRTQSFLSASKE